VAAAVLGLSLFVRLFQIDLAPFDIDQVHLLVRAAHFAQTGEIPLVGGSTFSVGVNIPPLITAILALPLLFTHSPVAVAAFQGVLDALAAAFVYAAVHQLATPFAAAAAGVSYAILPAAALNARWVSNGALVPFLCAMALWALIGFLRTGRAGQFALGFLAIGLAAELHLTAAIFLLVLLAAAAIRWPDLRAAPLALVSALLALTLAPYAYFQFSHGYPDLKAAGSFLGAPKQASPEALGVVASVIGGDIHARFSSAPLDIVGWVVLGLLLIGLIAAFAKGQPASALLVLWLVLPVAASIRHSEAVAPHYFLDVFPAIAVLTGLGIASLPLPPLRLAVLGLLVGLRLWQWVGFQSELAAGDLPSDYYVARPFSADYDPFLRYSPPYGVPLRYTQQATKLALDSSQGRPVYIGPRAGFEEVFRFLSQGGVAAVALRSNYSSVLPKPGALLLIDDTANGSALPEYRLESPVGEISGGTKKPIYSLVRLGESSLNVQPLEAEFGGGVRLAGVSVPPLAAGQPSQLRLEWQLGQAPAPQLSRIHLFAHVVDATGKVWSSSEDPPVFLGAQWQAGDGLLSDVDLALAPDAPIGGYWLELGLYDDNGSRLPVLSGGDQVRVGPLKVRGRPLAQAAPPRAVFGAGEIGLSAVEVSGEDVVLTWSALSKPPADYTVFVHALDAEGNLIAQHDGVPADGSYPTSLWDSGETVRDKHHLSASLAGAGKLEIGLYTKPDLQRLAVSTGGDAFQWTLS